MPKEEGAVLKAILLGDRAEVDVDANADFVNTGTVHVMAGLCTKPPSFAF